MVSYDLVDRTSQTLEGHSGGVIYYFRVLYQDLDHGVLLLLLTVAAVGLLQLFRNHHPRAREFFSSDLFVTALAVLLPVLLFTCAKTKLGWYIFCIYPSAALFAAMAFRSMLEHQPEDFSAYELICRSEAYSLYHHKTRNQLNCNQHICDMQANVVAVASKSRFAV